MNDENEPLLIGDFITSIKIERVFDEAWGTNNIVTMVVSDLSPNTNSTRKIIFDKVCDLHIENFDVLSANLLIISSIKERQWEHCNYEVLEHISGVIHFYCKSYTIIESEEKT